MGRRPKSSISSCRLAAGLGVIYRSDMFATVDNTVTLSGYARVDEALYHSFSDRIALQLNVENVLGKEYFVNADSNTNISPGVRSRNRLSR